MRFFGPVRILAAGAACGALLLTACSSGGDTESNDSATPVAGGTATYAVDTFPSCFDIHVSPQDITGEIQRAVFDSLVFEDVDGKFHPWLATKWEVADDLTSYTFHLREGVTFTDGTRFDAEAVKANFDHIVSADTKSQFAIALLGPYKGVEVVDPLTVKISFSKPFAPFLQAASTAYLGFYSPKALTDSADKFCGGGPALVGTGPFSVQSITQNQGLTLVKNPDYDWAPETAAHRGPAYLDRLEIRLLPEASTRLGALTSGQVDAARSIAPTNVAAVRRTPGLEVISQQAAGAPYSLYLNSRKAPFDDQRVRQAFQLAIDIETDVKTVYFGEYDRAWGPLSPTTPSYNAKLENSWPFDQDKANSLLDEAGWTGRDADGYRTKGGQRLSVLWPALPAQYVREQRDVLGQAIQADLKKVGIELAHPVIEVGESQTKSLEGAYHVLDFQWARYEPDVLRLFFNTASLPPAGQNAAFISDPRLDEWTNTGATTLDKAVRDDVYGQAQQRVVDLALTVPLYVSSTLLGVADRINGLDFDPNTWVSWYDAWRDRA